MEIIDKTIFAREVEEGLLSDPKRISSKYFYDEQGDALFQQIMHMPQYYLTPCELEIIDQQGKDIVEALAPMEGFDLIELGAGDGLKTKRLIQHLLEKGINFQYTPVDISDHFLDILKNDINTRFPQVTWNGRQGEYFDVLDDIASLDSGQKVILFLGSNIGNLTPKETIQFLKRMAKPLREQDSLLIGFDLKKDPDIILNAYNDSYGYTKEFNFNLLRRINKELGANFKIENFIHYPIYEPLSGQAQSYLISNIEQEVYIKELDLTVSFDAWEAIHTEISQKYDLGMIMNIAEQAGLMVANVFNDEKNYFADVVLRKM